MSEFSPCLGSIKFTCLLCKGSLLSLSIATNHVFTAFLVAKILMVECGYIFLSHNDTVIK